MCERQYGYDAGGEDQASYAENFAQKYPNVTLNQSWDYSTKQSYFTFGSSQESRAMDIMRGASSDPVITVGDYEDVDLNTVKWMQEKLTEQHDNRPLGKPFYMTVPGNKFTIMPIYQGGAGAKWDLHMVVNGVDYKVWSKHENLEVKFEDTDWLPVGSIGEGGEFDKNTMYASAVRAKTYTYDGFHAGDEMYFYLDITQGADTYCEQGAKLSSVDHYMLALEGFDKPANVPDGSEYMIIACEDANLENSDHDINDVVFLVYGHTKIPKPVEITEGTTVYDSKTVRYMIEDLGATDDFDFNDIVVDVTEYTPKTPVFVNDVLDHWNVGEKTQEATIRHLGGTLPFVLQIGDVELPERPGVLGADPDETFAVTGWDINNHNISIKVRQNASSTVYNNVQFPKAGEVPMIIAVDPSTNWMEERVSVPESWFYIPQE